MTEAAPFREEFWAALRRVRTGLLSVRGDAGEHVAPMTAHFDGEGPLFFYAPADGVLTRHSSKPPSARFFYTGPDHGLYASAEATLSIEPDISMRARFWSDEVEAWFPGGPDQERVTLLRCELGEAQVWLEASPHAGDGQTRDRRAHVDL